MLTLPPLRRFVSPNYSSRGGALVRLVVAHDCEGNYSGSIAWLANPKARASANAVLREDGGEATLQVDWKNKAWAVCDYNSISESIEAAGYSAKGLGAPEWQALADIIAYRLHVNHLPPVFCPGGEGSGFCQHGDLGARGGGHHDITSDPQVWKQFCAMVAAAYEQPMPDSWLPSGAMAPAPAPGYVPHIDPRHDHAVGSLEWVQLSLNALDIGGMSSSPLIVDGLDGVETRFAVRKFQRLHLLAIDGDAGPLTCAALAKATEEITGAN